MSSVFSMRIPRGWYSACLLPVLILCSCATKDTSHVMVVSVKDQKMALYRKGERLKDYPVSTSKFGLGDRRGSNFTPVGELEIASKVGDGMPLGTVFKGRKPTGEVLMPDAPGRDPIVTRILWLKGCCPQTTNAYSRYIYIHGTPEERKIGQPASYGCIRMKSQDVVELYDTVGVGAKVKIVNEPLPGSTMSVQLKKMAGAVGGAAKSIATLGLANRKKEKTL